MAEARGCRHSGLLSNSETVTERKGNSVTARSPVTWYFLASIDLEIERRCSFETLKEELSKQYMKIEDFYDSVSGTAW